MKRPQHPASAMARRYSLRCNSATPCHSSPKYEKNRSRTGRIQLGPGTSTTSASADLPSNCRRIAPLVAARNAVATIEHRAEGGALLTTGAHDVGSPLWISSGTAQASVGDDRPAANLFGILRNFSTGVTASSHAAVFSLAAAPGAWRFAAHL